MVDLVVPASGSTGFTVSSGFHGIGVLGHRSSRTRTKAAGTNGLEAENLAGFGVGEVLGVSVFGHRVGELGFTESGYSVVVEVVLVVSPFTVVGVHGIGELGGFRLR